MQMQCPDNPQFDGNFSMESGRTYVAAHKKGLDGIFYFDASDPDILHFRTCATEEYDNYEDECQWQSLSVENELLYRIYSERYQDFESSQGFSDNFNFKWWSPLSCILLHGGWMHLVGNAWFFWVYGAALERMLGTLRFVTIYFIGAFISVYVHLITLSPLAQDEPAFDDFMIPYRAFSEGSPVEIAKRNTVWKEWQATGGYQDPGNRAYFKGWAEPDFDDSDWELMEQAARWETRGLLLDGAVWFRRQGLCP